MGIAGDMSNILQGGGGGGSGGLAPGDAGGPVLDTIAPASWGANDVATIQLLGSNMLTGLTGTANGAALTAVNRQGPTETLIDFDTTTHPAGTYKIRLINPGGLKSNEMLFTVNP